MLVIYQGNNDFLIPLNCFCKSVCIWLALWAAVLVTIKIINEIIPGASYTQILLMKSFCAKLKRNDMSYKQGCAGLLWIGISMIILGWVLKVFNANDIIAPMNKNSDEIMLRKYNCAYINVKQSEVVSTLRRLISYSPIQGKDNMGWYCLNQKNLCTYKHCSFSIYI